MSSLTIDMLLGWRPAALEEHAAAVVRLRGQVESATVQAQSTQRAIPELWTGAAADAATTRLRGRIATGERLTETLDGVRRVLLGACDALTAAQALLVRAQEDAASAHLTLTRDGSVLPPPPRLLPQDASDDLVAETRRARIAQIETAESVEASVRQALRAAEEADADAAHALRSVWADAADGSGTADRAAEEAILLRTVPGPGTDPAEVAAWWASLSPEAQDLLVDRAWAQLGNLDGIPYPVRIRANRLAISAELAKEVRRQGALGVEQASLEAQLADLLASDTRLPSTRRLIDDLRARIDDIDVARARSLTTSDWYQTLLGTDQRDDEGALVSPPRQVVLFDPASGRFAEVVGDLSTATSVGVLVPGTGAKVGPSDGTYDRAVEFVASDRAGGTLAVLTFIGGPMPQSLAVDATRNSFADSIGPGLARFTAGIDHLPGATVTVVGHSYGGSVVGAAEAAGLRVDRVLHVESAGIGASVFTPDDLAWPDTPRYSMTAPGDPIELFQGVHLQGLGHGADPDTFPGVTRLETGVRIDRDPSSGLLRGVDAHGDVFLPESTSWVNMLAVMTGGEVTLYADPEFITTPSGVVVDYPMDNRGFQPDRTDVP